MSKEIEALEVLQNYVQVNETLETQEPYLKRLDAIRKALTPPTEQEVCEALGEYYDTKVYYEEQEFGTSFYLGKVKKDMNGKECTVKRTIVVSYEGEIGWNASLPPHLITLIGRFYEGKVKE